MKRLDEKKLRALVENSIDVITIANADARLEYISPSVKDVLGYEPDELVGKNGFELIWPEDLEKAQRIFKELQTARTPLSAVLRLKHKDGSLRWIESQVVHLADDPNIGGIISNFRDITDRRLIEDALKEAQDRFIAFMDASDMVAFVKDGEEFRYIYENGVFETRFKLTAFEILGKTDFELFPPAVAKRLRENDKVVLASWSVLKAEEVVPLLDGAPRFWSVTKFPFKDSRGKAYIGGVAVDITAQKVAERKEREIDRAKTEFVSLASHQLRTPLSTMNWYSEMLMDGDVGELTGKQKEYLAEIYRASKRMGELVDALLSVSRIELGTFALEARPTDIQEVMHDVLHDLEKEIKAKKLVLEENAEKPLGSFLVDPRMLRIILQNLLANAVRYTRIGGHITFGTRTEGGELKIKIADTGIGIPSYQHERVFEKFFRADNVRAADTDGTGLGLYIVKSLLDKIGGTISFESEEGRGTVFLVTIPEQKPN